MKPFACRVITPTLLGIFATTASSATEMEHCYFLPFPLWDFWHFCLAFPLLLLLFLTRAKIWVLPSLYREPHSQYPDHSGQVLRYALSLGVALPLDFGSVKVIFDTYKGSLAFNSHIHTIHSFIPQTMMKML